MSDDLLEGRRVLIVEDQFLIAEEMRRAVSAMGGEVVGPCSTVEAAMDRLKSEAVQFALLDVNVGDGEVTALADALAARQTPFVFATGAESWLIAPQHRDRVRLDKPVTRDALAEAVRQTLKK